MNIYIMKNFTLREVYFGLAEGDCREVVAAHEGNELSPVGHWRWDSEAIKWGEVEGNLHDELARSFIQALRREPPDDDWVVVMGGND